MAKIAQKQNLLWQWISWQFFDVPKEILKGWRNYLLFNLNYFSIPLLIRTLFSHWHRYRYSYGKRFDLKQYFEAFTFNIISRGLGAILRIIFILIGFLVEIFIILGGIIIFFGWLVWPVLLIAGLIFGFKILF